MEIGGCGLGYLKTTLVQELSSSVLHPSLQASCKQVPKQFKHSTDDLLWKGGEWKHRVNVVGREHNIRRRFSQWSQSSLKISKCKFSLKDSETQTFN